MNVQDRIYILRYFFLFFNGIFLILGIVLLGCGVWILFESNTFIATLRTTDEKILSVVFVAYVLIAIGFVTVLVCFMGCLGAYKEIRCLLILYMGCLFIILAAQVFVTFTLLANNGKIKTFMDKKVTDMIKEYGSPSGTDDDKKDWKLLDVVQKSLKCCGKVNSTDWLSNDYTNISGLYPCSCFNGTSSDDKLFCSLSQDESVYGTACGALIEEWLSSNILSILGIDFGLAVVQVLQFVFALYLFRNIGRRHTM